MTHTQEPWAIHSKVRAIVALTDAYKVFPNDNADFENDDLATGIALFADPSEYISEEETYANAFRIVACVNACAGIPIEFLEGNYILDSRNVIG